MVFRLTRPTLYMFQCHNFKNRCFHFQSFWNHSNPLWTPKAKLYKETLRLLQSDSDQIHFCALNIISFRNHPFSRPLFSLNMVPYILIVRFNWPLFASLPIFPPCSYCVINCPVLSSCHAYFLFLNFIKLTGVTLSSTSSFYCFALSVLRCSQHVSVTYWAVSTWLLKFSAATKSCVLDNFAVFTDFAAW